MSTTRISNNVGFTKEWENLQRKLGNVLSMAYSDADKKVIHLQDGRKITGKAAFKLAVKEAREQLKILGTLEPVTVEK